MECDGLNANPVYYTPGDATEQHIAELTSVPVLNIPLDLTTIRLLVGNYSCQDVGI